MVYITVKEASEKWGISTRRVCILCKNGRIVGAVKKSKVWMIPKDAKKPEDARIFDSNIERNPFLFLLNPSDAVVKGNVELSKFEKSVCEIQRQFFSGQLEKAYSGVSSLINIEKNEQFNCCLKIVKLMIVADMGKKDEYWAIINEIKNLEKKDKNNHIEKMLFDVYFGFNDIIDTEIFNEEDYEEFMPLLSLLVAKRGLNELIRNGNSSNISNYEMICKELDNKDCPLICAYYHIYLAVYLNAIGKIKSYQYHINKAVDILLPKGWYIPLAEYSSTIDLSFIKKIDAKAYKTIEMLSDKILSNYVNVGIFTLVLDNPRMNKEINIQIGFKIVQGKNNEQIARELGISLYKVKRHIEDIGSAIGSSSKKDIKSFVLRNFVL